MPSSEVAPIPARLAQSKLETSIVWHCSEQQLALWHQYNNAQRAAAEAHALHTQLGHRPASSQIAAVLGLPEPFSLSQCLAAGKVSYALCCITLLGLQ